MENPSILILHGWNLSSAVFEPLVDQFRSHGYKTYCIDLPGFGTSITPLKPLYLSDYVNFVTDFIKKKKLLKTVLVGHSFGGRIGIKIAAQNSGIIRALVLTGTPGYNPVPRLKIKFFLILAKAGRLIFSIPFLKVYQDIVRRFLYKAAQATDFYHTDIKMRQTFKNIISEDLKIYQKMIKTPTLLLWGEDDTIVPVAIARQMVKIIPQSRLKIISSRKHNLPYRQPQIFAQCVIDYLKTL